MKLQNFLIFSGSDHQKFCGVQKGRQNNFKLVAYSTGAVFQGYCMLIQVNSYSMANGTDAFRFLVFWLLPTLFLGRQGCLFIVISMTILPLTCWCDAINFVLISLEFLSWKDADESIFAAGIVSREFAGRRIR